MRFVVLAPNRWDGVWMNRQQIFSRLAQRHWVLYQLARSASDSGGARDQTAPIVCRPGGVLVDEPSALRRVPRFAPWDQFVIQHTARRWRRLAGPPEAGPLIAYVFHPKFWPYVEDLDADHLVYHAYDLYERNRGWTTKLELFQRLCVRKLTSPSRRPRRLPTRWHANMDVPRRSLGTAPTTRPSSRSRQRADRDPRIFWRSQGRASAIPARSAGRWISG